MPDIPEGMPSQMLTYQWFAEHRGWNPRIVDELTLEELFWFPVVNDSWAEALDVLRKIAEK